MVKQHQELWEENFTEGLTIDEAIRKLSPVNDFDEGKTFLFEMCSRINFYRSAYPILAESLEEAVEYILDSVKDLVDSSEYDELENIEDMTKDILASTARFYFGEYEK